MKTLLIVILIVLFIRVARSYFGTKSVEKPKILSSKMLSGNIELRELAPMIQASVLVSGSQKEAINQGFRQLAGYIFGGNTSKESVAMTAPVGVTKTSTTIAMTAPVGIQKEAKSYRVSFTMPSKYTIKTLPKPNDTNITFIEIPAKKWYVWKFSGYAKESRANKQLNEFQKTLKEQKITTEGASILNQYNDPLTIPFMRTNERWIEVK